MQKRDSLFLLNSFFRPMEVLAGRNFNDRLLVASTQSKWYEESKIVGECQVLHISMIYDLVKYCSVQDNFYFEQLYDLYAKEIYDIVRSNLVRLSEDKLTKLLTFPFVYIEVGHTLDIINGTGWCGICKDYCMPLKSEDNCFECAACYNRYHFDCFEVSDLLDPQKQRCNMCFNNDLELGWIANVNTAQKLLSSFKDFDTALLDVDHMALEWPFRYFGVHSNEESALDTDFSIVFPRCSVKVGPALQVRFVPEVIDQDSWLARYGKQLQQQMDDEPLVERSTSLLKFKRPEFIETSEINNFIKSTCESLLDAACGSCQFLQYLHELLFKNEFDFSKTLQDCHSFNLQLLFNNPSFSDEPILPLTKSIRWLETLYFESYNLDELIKEKGHLLYKIAESLKVPVKVICQYFAMYKKTDEQREAYDFYLRKYMNSKKFNKDVATPILKADNDAISATISVVEMEESSDQDAESSIDQNIKTPHCDNCYLTNPNVLIPTTIFQGRHSKKRREMFCKECGTYWLKYATTKPVAREVKTSNKSNLVDNNNKRNRRNSQQPTSFQQVPPRPIIPHVPCGVCLDDVAIDDMGSVTDQSAIKCNECNTVVHKICYDIPRFVPKDEIWKCDVCIKGVNRDASACCLCGKIDPQVTAVKLFQDQIAHVVCLYTNDSFMFSKVKGIREPILYKDIVDTQDLTCLYCHQSVGWKTCCVMQGCTKWFHPVCSTRAGSSFTFFDKSMRFFCSEHMTPMIPFDIHDPVNTIKDERRSSKMIKIQEELRYKRTELGKVSTPKFEREFEFHLYCDPKIDCGKSSSKRTMRKSSAHMKVPEFPPCAKCTLTSYPVLWESDEWKCIKCVRLEKEQ